MKTSLLLLVCLGSALAEVYFEDRFDKEDWESRWVQSTHKGAEAGKFAWTAGKFYGDADKDKGIQTSQDAKFYALSSEFKPFSNKDKPLVLQFTVKHEQNIDCGGGYAKLFDCNLDQQTCTAIHHTTLCLDLTFADLEPRRFMSFSTIREPTT